MKRGLGLDAQKLYEASRQFGAQQDQRVLADQLAGGREERRIAQEPLDFGYQQFQESMRYPQGSGLLHVVVAARTAFEVYGIRPWH
jgi:hypothetical protein